MGYRRIQGALSNPGHELARSTIADILRRHGIDPAPERSRKTTWKEFLSRHWELIVAADFFTVEVWTRRGLQRFVVLFFIELSTRKVQIAGIATGPNGLWMSQIGRNLTDAVDGLLRGKRYVVHDRDPLFTDEFLTILAGAGVKSVKLPARSPNLNAYAERFVRSINEGCLECMIFFGEGSLRKGIQEFGLHYHSERNHQGLGNRLIVPDEDRQQWWAHPTTSTTGRDVELLPPRRMGWATCSNRCKDFLGSALRWKSGSHTALGTQVGLCSNFDKADGLSLRLPRVRTAALGDLT